MNLHVPADSSSTYLLAILVYFYSYPCSQIFPVAENSSVKQSGKSTEKVPTQKVSTPKSVRGKPPTISKPNKIFKIPPKPFKKPIKQYKNTMSSLKMLPVLPVGVVDEFFSKNSLAPPTSSSDDSSSSRSDSKQSSPMNSPSGNINELDNVRRKFSLSNSSYTSSFDIESYRSPRNYLSLTESPFSCNNEATPTFLPNSSSTDYLLYDFNQNSGQISGQISGNVQHHVQNNEQNTGQNQNKGPNYHQTRNQSLPSFQELAKPMNNHSSVQNGSGMKMEWNENLQNNGNNNVRSKNSGYSQNSVGSVESNHSNHSSRSLKINKNVPKSETISQPATPSSTLDFQSLAVSPNPENRPELFNSYNSEFLMKLNCEEIVFKDNKSKRASRKRNRENVHPELSKYSSSFSPPLTVSTSPTALTTSNIDTSNSINTLINCIGPMSMPPNLHLSPLNQLPNSVASSSYANAMPPLNSNPLSSNNFEFKKTSKLNESSAQSQETQNPMKPSMISFSSSKSSKIQKNSKNSSSSSSSAKPPSPSCHSVASDDFTPIKQTFEKFINFLKDKRWTIAFAAYIFDYSATRMGEILKFRNIKSGKRMLPLWRKLVSNMILIMEDQALQRRLDKISRNFSSKKRVAEGHSALKAGKSGVDSGIGALDKFKRSLSHSDTSESVQDQVDKKIKRCESVF